MTPRILALAATLAAVVVAVVVGLLVVTRDDPPAPVPVPQAAAPPPASGGLVDPDWVTSVSEATEIPSRAVQAYAGAAVQVGDDDPECSIAWNTLAGIGRIESVHGAFGGARLDGDGVASPRIIGIPLDGTQGTAAIGDSDDGRLDGDTTWDRAVGPMQFIPTTWNRWGADGDGDGTRDPHDIDDAALAAARYLCHAGDDLSDSEGWSEAVLTYNRSVQYARDVARTATGYARDLDG